MISAIADKWLIILNSERKNLNQIDHFLNTDIKG